MNFVYLALIASLTGCSSFKPISKKRDIASARAITRVKDFDESQFRLKCPFDQRSIHTKSRSEVLLFTHDNLNEVSINWSSGDSEKLWNNTPKANPLLRVPNKLYNNTHYYNLERTKEKVISHAYETFEVEDLSGLTSCTKDYLVYSGSENFSCIAYRCKTSIKRNHI